jgi:hypothetical protein
VLLTDRRRSVRRPRALQLRGCSRFTLESRQNTLCDFQLSDLSTQFFSFRIEPLEPLGNPLLLLVHQHRHVYQPWRHGTGFDADTGILFGSRRTARSICSGSDAH